MSLHGVIMQKSVYDTDNDGIVNAAQVANSVPMSGVSGLSAALASKADMPSGGSTGDVMTKVEGGVAWVTPQSGSGGAVSWGGITGSLALQTDLNSALAAKQDVISSAVASTLTPGSSATLVISGGTMTIGVPAGSPGAAGSSGAPGSSGVTPVLSMGPVATLNPGSSAYASMTSAGSVYTISLGVPAGASGSPGSSGAAGSNGITPVISMGAVVTLDPGSSAYASMTSAGSVYTISLGIPEGSRGSNGNPGSSGVTPVLSMGSVATLDPGSSAYASMTSAGSVYTISMGVPRGSDGSGGTGAGNAVQSAGLTELASASSGTVLVYGDTASSGYQQGHIYKCTGTGGGGNSATLTGSRSFDGSEDWYYCSCALVPYEVSGTPQYVTVYGSQYQIYSGTCYYEGETVDPVTEEPTPWSGTWTWYMYPIEMDFPGEAEWVVGSTTSLSEWDAEATFLWAENSSVQALASTDQIAVEAGTWTSASLAVASGGGAPTFVDITPAGTVAWGDIQGTLSSQTDLASALGSCIAKNTSVTAIEYVTTLPASPGATIIYLIPES